MHGIIVPPRPGRFGATRPGRMYLHSSTVQTRSFDLTSAGKRKAIGLATLDSSIALGGALFINAAILALAAPTFHWAGQVQVAEIQDAHRLLSPLLATSAAGFLSAVALQASG